VGMGGGVCVLWFPGQTQTDVQGLHSHLCPAASGTEGKRAAEVQPSPALTTLVPLFWLGSYFLVLYLFFPALPVAI